MPTFRCGYTDTPDGSGRDHLVFRAPMLSVRIGFDSSYNSSKPVGYPSLPRDNLLALVDTGSRESCIDSELARRLGLPFIRHRQMVGAHGPKDVNVYRAHMFVPDLNQVVDGEFCAVDLAAGGVPHRALIGRTFLQFYAMTYDGRTGAVTISWD
jgi:hypothetical protein